jgi:hypothetical protein
VLSALYDIVSAKILERLRAAVTAHQGAVEKMRAALSAFLDFHFETGALLRVLQSEATRPGSFLETRRAAQFEAIQNLFDLEIRASQNRTVDPMIVLGIMYAIEGLSTAFLVEAVDGKFDRERAERVMMRIICTTLSADENVLPKMPLAKT